jgi:holo-[acyl-carrier-protein] synthase
MKISRVLGIGTDIVSVQRIESLVNRGPNFEQRFLWRVLHPIEIDEYAKKEEKKVQM